jgi:hypothetical protein
MVLSNDSRLYHFFVVQTQTTSENWIRLCLNQFSHTPGRIGIANPTLGVMSTFGALRS